MAAASASALAFSSASTFAFSSASSLAFSSASAAAASWSAASFSGVSAGWAAPLAAFFPGKSDLERFGSAAAAFAESSLAWAAASVASATPAARATSMAAASREGSRLPKKGCAALSSFSAAFFRASELSDTAVDCGCPPGAASLASTEKRRSGAAPKSLGPSTSLTVRSLSRFRSSPAGPRSSGGGGGGGGRFGGSTLGLSCSSRFHCSRSADAVAARASMALRHSSASDFSSESSASFCSMPFTSAVSTSSAFAASSGSAVVLVLPRCALEGVARISSLMFSSGRLPSGGLPGPSLHWMLSGVSFIQRFLIIPFLLLTGFFLR